jgi:hypothetical protein
MSQAIDEAREAFLRYLREECGDEAADCREDGIRSGRDDSEDYIRGYLAVLAKLDTHHEG